MRKPEYPEYLVVAANNQWAAHSMLSEAIRKCGLNEKSAQDDCAGMIEIALEDGENVDWGWIEEQVINAHDSHWRTRPIDLVIYYIDPEVWTGYEVSGFDGSVTFYGMEDASPEEQRKAIYSRRIAATWKGGAIVERKETDRAAA